MTHKGIHHCIVYNNERLGTTKMKATGGWLSKSQHIYTEEYHAAVRENEESMYA